MTRRVENYRRWLDRQITPERTRDYTELFDALFAKEFVWLIPNDDNRREDGLDVRAEYFHGRGKLDYPCSILEVIVGLSRHLAFNAGGDPRRWAWTLISNLELNQVSGHIGRIRAERVEEILHNLVWRTYRRDGRGGFFPLVHTDLDQRTVELWYQMHAYMDENCAT